MPLAPQSLGRSSVPWAPVSDTPVSSSGSAMCQLWNCQKVTSLDITALIGKMNQNSSYSCSPEELMRLASTEPGTQKDVVFTMTVNPKRLHKSKTYLPQESS